MGYSDEELRKFLNEDLEQGLVDADDPLNMRDQHENIAESDEEEERKNHE